MNDSPIEIHHLRIPAADASGRPCEVAASIYLPAPRALASGTDILFLLPGGGYGRGYFNLPVPGFSQATYHAGRGNTVVALDYPGAGESPSTPETSVADGITALHQAVTYIANRLEQGTLLPGLGPVSYGALVAAGQSLGGHLLVATQAAHATFKGIAVLGASMVGTQFPLPSGGVTTSGREADFPYAFHWGEIAEVDPAVMPTDLETLKGVDVAIGSPSRTRPAPWASMSAPPYTLALLGDGAPGAAAARITCPVLLAAGERDVTHALEEEATTFSGAPEVATFTLPQSAHMHNFAEMREQLWKRLDTFVMHASTYDRKASGASL
jgi:pimeloyl-ACP methyl ester carboxylesterase